MMRVVGLVGLLLASSFGMVEAAPTPPAQAKGILKTANGEEIGVALFTQGLGGAVNATIAAKNLPPGDHGVSLREQGACAPDFNAAGAALTVALPKLTMPASGSGTLLASTPDVSISTTPAPLLDTDGTAVVITALGDENNKVACAVLEAVPVPLPAPEATGATGATAQIALPSGEVVGSAAMTQNYNGTVRILVQVQNLPPGDHGIHLHQFGMCGPTFGAAGDHHNPWNTHHGISNPETPRPHSGDLPNLTVNADGSGTLDITTDLFSLVASDHTILDSDGSSVVIHANPDDLNSDPSGMSGGRIACGVVQAGATPASLPDTGAPSMPLVLLTLAALVTLAGGVLLRRSSRA